VTINLDHANSVMTLLGGLVLVLGGLVAVLRYVIRAETAKVHDVGAQVLHQVKNSHTTNLRDDLDNLHQAVRDVERRTGRRLDNLDGKADATSEALKAHVVQSEALQAKGRAAEQQIRDSLQHVAAAVENLTKPDDS
jgi:hypothetical protein